MQEDNHCTRTPAPDEGKGTNPWLRQGNSECIWRLCSTFNVCYYFLFLPPSFSMSESQAFERQATGDLGDLVKLLTDSYCSIAFSNIEHWFFLSSHIPIDSLPLDYLSKSEPSSFYSGRFSSPPSLSSLLSHDLSLLCYSPAFFLLEQICGSSFKAQ